MEADKMKRKLLFALVVVLSAAFNFSGAFASPFLPIFREGIYSDFCVLNEERDEKYADLMRVSVKVSVKGGSGSGTICYYDHATGWAYVLSCGHLWSGDKKYDPKSKGRAKITTWYKSGSRLDNPAMFEAESLFWSNRRGYDVGMLRFKPDWDPLCAPISTSFDPKKGTYLNSMGCDGGSEVARYQVRVVSFSSPDIITELNSPRPGRSGGGLLDDSGEIVGVCWGTSDTSSGNGQGFFTPLEAIKHILQSNDHAWIILPNWTVRDIPVFDHGSKSLMNGFEFVPVPSFR
jgi:hypothetical protein